MSSATDRWIRSTTTRSVGLLALIAGTVSYLHLHSMDGEVGATSWQRHSDPIADPVAAVRDGARIIDELQGREGTALPAGRARMETRFAGEPWEPS